MKTAEKATIQELLKHPRPRPEWKVREAMTAWMNANNADEYTERLIDATIKQHLSTPEEQLRKLLEEKQVTLEGVTLTVKGKKKGMSEEELLTYLPPAVKLRTVKVKLKAKTPYETDRIQKVYYGLLGNIKLKNDKALMNNIIDNNKSYLRTRISCDITLKGKNASASLTVYECLPENAQAFVDWWVGRQITPSDFAMQVYQFKSAMSEHNVGEVKVREAPTKTTTVHMAALAFAWR